MSHWRRIVIDSRYRTADSLSNADFRVALPYPVQVPAGSRMYADAVSLSHSWGNIEVDKNDRLYVEEIVVGVSAPHLRTIQLAHGNYNTSTLRTELQSKLNTGTNLAGTYTVSLAHGKFLISNSSDQATQGKAKIYTQLDRVYLANVVPGFPGAFANEAIGHVQNSGSDPYIYNGNQLFGTFVDLQLHKQIFIHAPGLGESSMMTMRGNTDVIRRVLLSNSTSGDVINDVLQTGLAPITFSSDTVLSVLSFQIKGYEGDLVNMGGHQISWEFIIERPGAE